MLILNLSALFFKILNWNSGIEFILIDAIEVLASREISEIYLDPYFKNTSKLGNLTEEKFYSGNCFNIWSIWVLGSITLLTFLSIALKILKVEDE